MDPTTSIPDQAHRLLDDVNLRKAELLRVMAEWPMLTCHGLGWQNEGKYLHGVPTSSPLVEIYQAQRDALIHEVLTQDECIHKIGEDHSAYQGVEHYGEIPLALTYLTYCQRAKGKRAGSYGVKHRAEGIGLRPYYVSNGSMIAAVCMVRGAITPDGINAGLGILEPKRCGESGVKKSGCGALIIPAGSKKRLCDECRK